MLFLAVPAIGAELAGGETGSLNHVVKAVITERSEFHLFADLFHHVCVFGSVGIGLELEALGCAFAALQLVDDAAADEGHIGGRAGEIQIFAAVHDRRAGYADAVLYAGAFCRSEASIYCGTAESTF